MQYARKSALGILSSYSHSGPKMGIMSVSNKKQALHAKIVSEVLACLAVDSSSDYEVRRNYLAKNNAKSIGKPENVSRYSMLVFRICDHTGEVIDHRNVSIYLLAGKNYSPDKLPKGFFVDKQMNHESHSLVYYVDAEEMSKLRDGYYGLRVQVRPSSGFSFYRTAEFHSEGIPITRIFAPNETTYIEVTMKRYVDENLFRLAPVTAKRENFKRDKPSGQSIELTGKP